MATNSSTQEKLEQLEEEEEEEEEEALSLCDLPVKMVDNEGQSGKQESKIIETQDEFDFCSWGGPFSEESEMCVADEVFFQGQILPLHLSLRTTNFQRVGQQFKRCQSSSESLGHGSLSEFRSNSSRSSSLRSQNSSSSSSSTITTTPRISKPRVQGQFHMHPCPKPQLRVTVPRQASFGNQVKKSSAWGFLRLGLMPATEMGLQDLKVRKNANKNDVHANSTTKSVKMSCSTNRSGKRSDIFKHIMGKGGGCKCSAETVRSDIIIIRSGTKSTNKAESTTHAMKEKVVELKRQNHRQKQGKKNVSHRRTLEWIKELSHASYPDEEALLSNS